jgi:hypothetical protein
MLPVHWQDARASKCFPSLRLKSALFIQHLELLKVCQLGSPTAKVFDFPLRERTTNCRDNRIAALKFALMEQVVCFDVGHSRCF